MCHYCGCRDSPLIKRYIAEHESVTDPARAATRALDDGAVPTARRSPRRMAAELADHWKGEEGGLFRASLTS